jgi:threonine dehydrogenase-like Zn-dependent dehydrogenase
MERIGFGDVFPTASDPVIFGHEFCCEVLDYGPGCKRKIKPGTRVVSVPLIRTGRSVRQTGYDRTYGGGYAERMLLPEWGLLPVPNGLSDEMATLTEPMAVGLHAVHRAEVKSKDVAIVIGCGPVGLAVICLLKAKGVRTIIASDFSAGRRALAQKCGADVLINPAETSPYANWQEYGFMGDMQTLLNLAVDTREKLGRLPLPWYTTWRIAEKLGATPPRPVIFECVGVPGMLQRIIDGAPLLSRVVVAGVCMEMDRIEPALGIAKEVDLRFVFGYSPLEYLIAEGKVNCGPMITGTVGLDGVAGAFDALRDPEKHAKILIDPAAANATQ